MYASMHSADSLSTSTSGSSEHSFFNRNVDHIINGKEGKMFVGGLADKTTVDTLRLYFSNFGGIEECTIMRDAKTKLSRGFAFVTFFDPACIQKVLSVKDHYLDGKKIDPQTAVRNISPARSVHNVFKKIFIGGVSKQTSVEDLKAYFSEKFGEIEDVVLKLDYSKQQHRGFGFITFVDSTVADKVCEKRFHMIDSKMVETKNAQKKEFVNYNSMNPVNSIAPDQLSTLYGMIVSSPPPTMISCAPMFSNFPPALEQQTTQFVDYNNSAFRRRIAAKYLSQAPSNLYY